jgi:hypothetical protein
MLSSGIWRLEALVRTGVSEEHITIIRDERINDLVNEKGSIGWRTREVGGGKGVWAL